ncbi:MAG: hypothetical protein IPK83_08500 [Planctomycetes bacterium]|nr:hypothetical protein [Planctomycetota bacterium]
MAITSGSGIYIGQFNPQREELFAALTLILLGVVTAVLVWIIPVPMPRFMKEAASNPTDAESAERAKKSRIMRTVGLCLWGLAILLIPILLISVPERDWDEVFPATMVPLGVTGAALFFGSLATGRARRKEKKPAVELPLKRSLRVESVTHLRRMLEQYAFLKGYRMDSHGELLWRFLRGDWTAQFWQSDVREWKTELNIVAYEDGQGGYRTTCQLDVDSRFNSPDRTMLLKLNEEMDELQNMLEGSGSALGREIQV